MQCTNCGNEVPDTARVCGHCGHRLVASSLPVKERQSGWLWGAAGCVLLAIVGFIVLAAIGFFLLPDLQITLW